MGWNTLHVRRAHPVLAGIATGDGGLHAYFVHSFQLYPANPADVVAAADYGGPVTAMVGARQCRRHAVPSREEPEARPGADRQFPEVAPVILFPAIDLKSGECVRLVRGDMAQATVFNADPAAQARIFEAQRLRVAACRRSRRRLRRQADERRGGRAHSRRVTMKVQLGGGVRDMKTVAGWLEKGVARVIIGTAAVEDPGFVREASRLYPGRVAVGIDARDGRVAVDGWARTSDVAAVDLGRRFEDAGVAALIYTDISRDGVMQGLNIAATVALAEAVATPVIASGGLASIEDVKRLLEPDCARLAGAITGRALYDGRLDAREALALIRGAKASGGVALTHQNATKGSDSIMTESVKVIAHGESIRC